MQLIKAIRIN